MKIFIPDILVYEGEQLTEDTFNTFKELVCSNLGTNFTRIDANNQLQYVIFYWGESDYPSHLTVKLNQYFLFNTEEKEQYLIVDNLIYNNIKVI